MIKKTIKRINVSISIFAFVNIMFVIIAEYLQNTRYYVQAERIIKLLFNPKTPIYFNYWLIYLLCAILITIFLTFKKIYNIFEMILLVGINSALSIVIFVCIINRM